MVKTLASNVRSVLLSAPEVGPLQKLRRDSVLFQQNQDGVGLFLIEDGLVKLIRTSKNGNKLILSIAGPHQLVGEEVLAQGQGAYLSDIVCLTDVAGYNIPLSTIKRLFGVPELAISLLSYTILRDIERISRIEMLTVYDVEHRILHSLAELASMVKPNSDGSTYPIPMTQVDIAGFVGATRETTSTTLSGLQSRQLVTLGRRLVTTVHPNILIDAANDKLAGGRSTF
jgi:CRP-like cAMP-binding protein